MKTRLTITLFISLLLCIFTLGSSNRAMAQTDTSIYMIRTSDGQQFMGKILKQDAREVTILTEDRGELIIPKFQIKEMKVVKSGELNPKGDYIPEEAFATRYFLTTNGLPIQKGENYIEWNIFGPDAQFGVGENFGVGVMTSWIGIPIIGSIKYSFPLAERVHMGFGSLVGTGSWINPTFAGVLPYGVFTFGDRRDNFNISYGYAGITFDGDFEGRALLSFAGMTKVGKKVSLVFDSFIIPQFMNDTDETFAVFVPGLRFETKPQRAFQFGFGGVSAGGVAIPVPIPIVQWFWQL
ncbi:MAG: hypothetical protein H6606_09820 [Flavobacteriales bacterium]|nr:hypothetical protein [Flavobacteriales bacterium]